jgi:hypothetical protein
MAMVSAATMAIKEESHGRRFLICPWLGVFIR